MKVILLFILLALAAFLSSCATGPDYTPDVQAHAASWGAPTLSARGIMLAPGSAPETRHTMLHD